MTQNIHIVTHPLVQHKVSLLRMVETGCAEFRRLVRELGILLAYEVTRGVATTMVDVTTPLAATRAPVIDTRQIVLVSILRSGSTIIEGMLELLPTARVGQIGLYRDPLTLTPVEYYCKLPGDVQNRDLIVASPLIATGSSAAAAVSRLKECAPASIKFVSILASQAGIELLQAEHPDVQIYTAAIDPQVNEAGFIVPGLGDAGDRLFGTK